MGKKRKQTVKVPAKGPLLAILLVALFVFCSYMGLQVLFDIPANLSNYFIWDKTPVFNALNSAYEVVFLLLLAVSLWLFFRKEKA